MIDADEIRKKAVPHTRGEHGYNADIRKWAVLVGDIDDAQTIEAEPVKRGRWESRSVLVGYMKFEHYYACTACGQKGGKAKTNYCPNCGAKMDLEE